MDTHQNNPVVRLWRALWLGEGDATALIADQFTRHGQSGSGVFSPAEHEQRIRAATSHLRGTDLRVHQLVEQGDITFLRITLAGVSVTTGESVALSLLGEYRTVDGKVAESWTLHHADHCWD